MIQAEIVADSLSPQGHRTTSVLATFPRIILAEVNTHRMLSKNTSSSRAIPFPKSLHSVLTNPFIPIAWQKKHPGMQGSEYYSKTEKFSLIAFTSVAVDTMNQHKRGTPEHEKLEKALTEKMDLIQTYLKNYTYQVKTLDEWWLLARDKAVESATILYCFDVTKQLANRLLEPFMWTTMLITGPRSGWENFFHLRCPSYTFHDNKGEYVYKSRKEAIKIHGEHEEVEYLTRNKSLIDLNIIDWLNVNTGQAEIHMMALAECIYDAMNESTPKQLQANEWHIPFENKIDYVTLQEKLGATSSWECEKLKVKLSVAMSARTSYTVVGEEKALNYTDLIGLHDRLLTQTPPHSSPLEHCAVAMSDEEFYLFSKGMDGSADHEHGWCFNLRGFMSYRYLIDTKKKVWL